MLLRPTRVRAKPVRFHISAHGYVKNAPRFTLPNRDRPKTHPVLGLDLRRGKFRGRMLLRPTRVHAKPVRFHISAHGYVKNAPRFTLPNRDRPKTHPVLGLDLRRGKFRGRMLLRPTRVHAKIDGFHISAHGYAKNAPGFTIPNRDRPKSHPVLYPNLRRCYFRGVCFCALHGYVKNPAGFTFPHPDTPKTHPISPFPIRIRPKPVRF